MPQTGKSGRGGDSPRAFWRSLPVVIERDASRALDELEGYSSPIEGGRDWGQTTHDELLEVGVWSAMGSLLRNAFIEALRPRSGRSCTVQLWHS